MARKLLLRTAAITAPGLADENGQPPTLVYGRMLDTILRWAPPGKGATLDEVTRAVEALRPINEAIRENADHVILDEEAWKTLVAKLAEFPFGVADEAIVEFGLMIRNAPEIGTEEPTVVRAARRVS